MFSKNEPCYHTKLSHVTKQLSHITKKWAKITELCYQQTEPRYKNKKPCYTKNWAMLQKKWAIFKKMSHVTVPKNLCHVSKKTEPCYTKLCHVTKKYGAMLSKNWAMLPRNIANFSQKTEPCYPKRKHVILLLFIVHRIRIKTEEKAKVVVSVWEEEFIHFLAALAVLIRTILNWLKFILFLQIILV